MNAILYVYGNTSFQRSSTNVIHTQWLYSIPRGFLKLRTQRTGELRTYSTDCRHRMIMQNVDAFNPCFDIPDFAFCVPAPTSWFAAYSVFKYPSSSENILSRRPRHKLSCEYYLRKEKTIFLVFHWTTRSPSRCLMTFAWSYGKLKRRYWTLNTANVQLYSILLYDFPFQGFVSKRNWRFHARGRWIFEYSTEQ